MSSFTFFSNIPQPQDQPSVSQGEILQNFTALGRPDGAGGSWTTQDHYGFGTGTDGEHKQVTFANVEAPAVPANPASILYTKNDAFANPQLFFLNNVNTAQYIIGPSGCIPLFAGIILQWKLVSTSPGGIPFTFPLPFPHSVFAVTLGGLATGAQSFSLSGIGLGGGTAYNQVGGGNQSAYIIALGN